MVGEGVRMHPGPAQLPAGPPEGEGNKFSQGMRSTTVKFVE